MGTPIPAIDPEVAPGTIGLVTPIGEPVAPVGPLKFSYALHTYSPTSINLSNVPEAYK